MFANVNILFQAMQSLQAKEQGDPHYQELVKKLSEKLSIPEAQVECNIALLASGANDLVLR